MGVSCNEIQGSWHGTPLPVRCEVKHGEGRSSVVRPFHLDGAGMGLTRSCGNRDYRLGACRDGAHVAGSR